MYYIYKEEKETTGTSGCRATWEVVLMIFVFRTVVGSLR